MPRRDEDEEDDYDDRRSAPRSRRPKRRDDEDEEDDYDRRPDERPDEPEPGTCPECGCRRSTKINFTWWGGVVGPSIFNLVKCRECGQQYNRKTGAAFGWAPIIIYSIVVGGVCLVLFGLLFGVMLR